ncbi:hypothetical protein AVEN_133045-1 [Araneus ventricosus]|uniref:Uncharacterized protein n=1 Tax=Araneus ventricosus TaxID=182803 RepID=A0A4Y2K472_ARAVE|nr:hypothetical protein AVEN_133045-1 [Araneus ventricosus]
MGGSVGYGHHTNWRTFGYCVFSMQQAQHTADLQWNRVSGLGPSGLEAGALPLGHRVPMKNMQQAQYTADLQWNRVSGLEPSGLEASALPLGHRGP